MKVRTRQGDEYKVVETKDTIDAVVPAADVADRTTGLEVLRLDVEEAPGGKYARFWVSVSIVNGKPKLRITTEDKNRKTHKSGLYGSFRIDGPAPL